MKYEPHMKPTAQETTIWRKLYMARLRSYVDGYQGHMSAALSDLLTANQVGDPDAIERCERMFDTIRTTCRQASANLQWFEERYDSETGGAK